MIGFIELIELIGLIEFIELIELIGLMELIELIELIGLIEFGVFLVIGCRKQRGIRFRV